MANGNYPSYTPHDTATRQIPPRDPDILHRTDYTEFESVSEAIVSTIAHIEGTEATELRSLFEETDIESLETLLAATPPDRTLVVLLSVDQYLVTCHNNGPLCIQRES